MIELLTYTGPWGPLIALAIAVPAWFLVLGACLFAQGPLLDLSLARARRRDARKEAFRQRALEAPLYIDHVALSRSR